MKKPINKVQFNKWAKNRTFDYASRSVWKEKHKYRLRFTVTFTPSLWFLVTLGNETMYEGLNFDLAANAFNHECEG